MRDRYHHGELRQAMLDAAIEELAEHGEEGLSVRSLADRVGVSHAAPYHHFGKRDDLLGSIAEEGFRRAHAALDQVEEVEPRERLVQLGLAYVHFGWENPALFRLMFGHGLRFSDRHEGLAVAVGGFWQLLLGPVGELVRSGHLGPDDDAVELVAFSLWAQVHGLSSIFANRDRWSIDGIEVSPGTDDGWLRISLEATLRGFDRRHQPTS